MEAEAGREKDKALQQQTPYVVVAQVGSPCLLTDGQPRSGGATMCWLLLVGQKKQGAVWPNERGELLTVLTVESAVTLSES